MTVRLGVSTCYLDVNTADLTMELKRKDLDFHIYSGKLTIQLSW